MPNKLFSFVTKRVLVSYWPKASAGLVVVVVIIPIVFIIRKYHRTFRIFFAYQAAIPFKAAQSIKFQFFWLVFFIVLTMAKPVVYRSVARVFHSQTSNFCLKCQVSRLSPPVFSDQVLISNPKFAVISASASLSTFNTMLNHSLSCCVHSTGMQAVESKNIILFQKKSVSLLPTTREFFGRRVVTELCVALPPCPAKKLNIQAAQKDDDVILDGLLKLAPGLESTAAIGGYSKQVYDYMKKKITTTEMKKKATEEQIDEMVVSYIKCYGAKLVQMQNDEKRKKEAHNADMKLKNADVKLKNADAKLKKAAKKGLKETQDQKILFDKETHDQKILSDKAAEKRLEAAEKRIQDEHDYKMASNIEPKS